MRIVLNLSPPLIAISSGSIDLDRLVGARLGLRVGRLGVGAAAEHQLRLHRPVGVPLPDLARRLLDLGRVVMLEVAACHRY